MQICFVLLCALLLLYRPINFPLSIFAHSRSLRYVFFKSFITLSHIVVFKLLSRERELDFLCSLTLDTVPVHVCACMTYKQDRARLSPLCASALFLPTPFFGPYYISSTMVLDVEVDPAPEVVKPGDNTGLKYQKVLSQSRMLSLE